jgi:hypothetical protein
VVGSFAIVGHDWIDVPVMFVIVFLGLLGVSIWGAAILSRRYERRRIEEGAWSASGPKHPTEAPPDYSQSRGRQAFDWSQRQAQFIEPDAAAPGEDEDASPERNER